MVVPDTPIEELVIQGIEAKLAAVNGPTSTYFFTMAKVVRYEDWSDDLLEFPAVMIAALDSSKSDEKFAGIVETRMRVQLTGVLEAWEEQTLRTSELLHDMEKALTTDITLAGVALDCAVLETSRFLVQEETSPRAGATMVVEVIFRHGRADPAESIP